MTRPAGSIKGALTYLPSKRQTDATLDQAAPVQNTWYPILNTTRNVCIRGISIRVATTGEDLEARITIDGNVIAGGVAAAANTDYYVSLSSYTTVPNAIVIDATFTRDGMLLEGRTVKVEVRKTSIAGAGNLQGKVAYGKW